MEQNAAEALVDLNNTNRRKIINGSEFVDIFLDTNRFSYFGERRPHNER